MFLKKHIVNNNSEVKIMKKKTKITREYSETDAFDQINKYGTYNIQDTADTSNLFPMIAHGLPIKEKQNKGHKSETQSKK